LPENGKIEHSLDQNHVGVVADRFPGEQSLSSAAGVDEERRSRCCGHRD
jgi:hypothetical protein